MVGFSSEFTTRERRRKMKRLWISNLFLVLIVFGIAQTNTVNAAENYPVKPITVIVPFEPGRAGILKHAR